MKPLTQLDNIDKAVLLHSLFPDEIPALLDFIKNLALTMKEDGPITIWSKGILAEDMSADILKMIIETIESEKMRLIKRSKAFADHLFDGFTSLLTRYCMEQYITIRAHKNKKFVQCCDLLFGL